MSTKIYAPFTYLIGWSKLNKWYYGVRIKPDTTPADLWSTYFTSSNIVKHYRKIYGEPDTVKVRRIFDTKEQALLWEHKVLRRLRVKKRNEWLNISHGYGDTHSLTQTEQSKQKISNTRNERIAAGIIIPAKHTEGHKQKLRKYNPGGEATAKAVYQIDATTGEVIKEWKSTRQAGVGLNIKTWRNISTAINKNRIQTVYGFYWRWVGDPDVVDHKLINIAELNTIRLDPSKRSGKRIQQLDGSGNIIKEWNTMGEAEKHFGLCSSTISYAIKTGKLCTGFYWKKINL